MAVEKLDPTAKDPNSVGISSELAYDVIQLPSLGLLYDESSPLHNKETIEVYYMTAKDEDILTSPNLVKSGEFINVLLRNTLRNKKIDPKKLLQCDIDAIVVWLRASGYGPEYGVSLLCNACGKRFEQEFMLDSFEMTTLDSANLNQDGLFEFTLPKSEKVITFSLLTGEDDDSAEKEIAKLQKQLNSPYQQSTTLKMAKMIRSIDGNPDRGVINKFVTSMSIIDARAFRKEIARVTPGIQMKATATCSFCNESEEVDIPITTEFFWPE